MSGSNRRGWVVTQTYEPIPQTPSYRPNERPVETICDLCDDKASHQDTGWLAEWRQDDSGVGRRENCRVLSDWGFTYTEIAIKIDLCPNCFYGKLVPWLKEQGVDVEKRTRKQGGIGMEGGW